MEYKFTHQLTAKKNYAKTDLSVNNCAKINLGVNNKLRENEFGCKQMHENKLKEKEIWKKCAKLKLTVKE